MSEIMTKEERQTAWDALKLRLEAKRWTIYEGADRLDVPESGYRNLMDGTTKCPTQATLALLTVRLNDAEKHHRAGVVTQRQGPSLPTSTAEPAKP